VSVNGHSVVEEDTEENLLKEKIKEYGIGQ